MSINERTQGRHRVVYAAGPRVLLLRPSLVNVDVTTPVICRRGVVNPSTGNSEEVGGRTKFAAMGTPSAKRSGRREH